MDPKKIGFLGVEKIRPFNPFGKEPSDIEKYAYAVFMKVDDVQEQKKAIMAKYLIGNQQENNKIKKDIEDKMYKALLNIEENYETYKIIEKARKNSPAFIKARMEEKRVIDAQKKIEIRIAKEKEEILLKPYIEKITSEHQAQLKKEKVFDDRCKKIDDERGHTAYIQMTHEQNKLHNLPIPALLNSVEKMKVEQDKIKAEKNLKAARELRERKLKEDHEKFVRWREESVKSRKEEEEQKASSLSQKRKLFEEALTQGKTVEEAFRVSSGY